jgi:hypothetical protein
MPGSAAPSQRNGRCSSAGWRALLLLTLIAPAIHAHDSRPLSITLTERDTGLYTLEWKLPPVLPPETWPTVTLEGECRPALEAAAPATLTGGHEGRTARGVTQRAYRCPNGVAGHSVRVTYPVVNPSLSSLLRVTWRSGESRVVAAGPDTDTIPLPDASTFGAVARSYTRLGVQHIWAGADHLLFLACLLWIAGRGRRIVWAITGFTVGHSVTLALATLGVVRVPVAAVETCIALSVAFLAAELVRGREDTVTRRFPLAVAAAFGLLHGFGFATVLAELGVPATQTVTALLFFNLGVELGQLGFAAAMLALAALARGVLPAVALPRFAATVPYFAGAVAAYWVIERIADVLPA